MSKPICLVTAPVTTRSGYGAHARDICRALIKLDKFDVKIWGVRWGNTPMNALYEDDPNDKIIIDRLLKEPKLGNLNLVNDYRNYYTDELIEIVSKIYPLIVR